MITLRKINYVSAVFFGVLALAFSVLFGVFQWYLSNQRSDLATQFGIPLGLGFFNAVILNPIIAALLYYVIALVIIWIYNKTAKRYPLSWQLSK